MCVPRLGASNCHVCLMLFCPMSMTWFPSSLQPNSSRDMCSVVGGPILFSAGLLRAMQALPGIAKQCTSPMRHHPMHGCANVAARHVGIPMLHDAHAPLCLEGGVAPEMPKKVMQHCLFAFQCPLPDCNVDGRFFACLCHVIPYDMCNLSLSRYRVWCPWLGSLVLMGKPLPFCP